MQPTCLRGGCQVSNLLCTPLAPEPARYPGYCLEPLEEPLAEVLPEGHKPGELYPGLLHSLLLLAGWDSALL